MTITSEQRQSLEAQFAALPDGNLDAKYQMVRTSLGAGSYPWGAQRWQLEIWMEIILAEYAKRQLSVPQIRR